MSTATFSGTSTARFSGARRQRHPAASGEPTTRSLARHLRSVSGPATDFVVILVGHENNFGGAVTVDQVTKTQYAIQVASDVYAWRGRRVRRGGALVRGRSQGSLEDG
ncbi:hypothetical protein OKJ48_00620 [Streptomyces kunmingensis]|uniref:Uncharacterized protein n=1 Tax=Streptomyces kunmingensis TaxID=68225 RepID=A0ABU6C2I7_9ACTN|nr:hypothetical protein [Streptomyces kunmingensis]MEB3958768.1 hypothetical protein [Streptomyces kunmingensis]